MQGSPKLFDEDTLFRGRDREFLKCDCSCFRHIACATCHIAPVKSSECKTESVPFLRRQDVRLMPRDETGSTPPFVVRIGDEVLPSAPEDYGSGRQRRILEPGEYVSIEIKFRRQREVGPA